MNHLFLRSSPGLDSFPGDFRRGSEVDDEVHAEVDLRTRGQELEPLAEDPEFGVGQLAAAMKVLDEAVPRAVQTSFHHLKTFKHLKSTLLKSNSTLFIIKKTSLAITFL